MDRTLAHTHCGNCGAALSGPYCSACGQHAHESARSVAALFHDAWHLATHVDGRFWQTLYTLLLRPGVLSKEYFAEHRARYLPPVRVYLVLSVVFFALGSFNPQMTTGNVRGVRALPAEAATPKNDAPPAKNVADADDDEDKDDDFNFSESDCQSIQPGIAWIDKQLQAACLRHAKDGGLSIKEAFVHNIPKMMFVFVPLVALTMLMLYWRPRRLYVEHLVFFLHNHAAMFLILVLEAAASRVAHLTGHRSMARWVVAITMFYAMWYVYRAMRVYYGQGRIKTTAKLLVVGFAYVIGFGTTLFITLVVSFVVA